jgi:hypothetical protein
MSYDIEIYDKSKCSTCGTPANESKSFNITFNIRPMLDYVGITFQRMEDANNDELVYLAKELVRRLEKPQYQLGLESLNPANGWGSLAALQTTARNIYKAVYGMTRPGMRLT